MKTDRKMKRSQNPELSLCRQLSLSVGLRTMVLRESLGLDRVDCSSVLPGIAHDGQSRKELLKDCDVGEPVRVVDSRCMCDSCGGDTLNNRFPFISWVDRFADFYLSYLNGLPWLFLLSILVWALYWAIQSLSFSLDLIGGAL